MDGKYSRFRELWAVPRFRALFKMGCWIAFFIIFSAIFVLGGGYRPIEDNRTQQDGPTYLTMKEDIEKANLSIDIYITSTEDILIDGTIINNSLEGILETDEIVRVRITSESVYIITRDEEVLTDILDELNLMLLFPSQIFEIINRSETESTPSYDNRIFFYTIDNLNISIHTNETAIYKIIILDGNITYELEFSII